MKQNKHKTLITCDCGGNINSVFAYERNDKMKKIQGFGYCRECKKVFKIGVKEV